MKNLRVCVALAINAGVSMMALFVVLGRMIVSAFGGDGVTIESVCWACLPVCGIASSLAAIGWMRQAYKVLGDVNGALTVVLRNIRSGTAFHLTATRRAMEQIDKVME
jgi:hypothetical protein